MTSKGIRTGAVVLAAGFSSRMGKCKALLDVGGSAALERILSTLRLSGVKDIVVVSGHYREAVEGEAKRGGARAVFNEHYEKGMLSSIKAGVTALSSNLDGFFLLPVDVPLVKPATLQALKQARRSEPNSAVVIPAFLGRRGHPPLVATRLIPGILEWDGPGGLRTFLDRYEEASLVLEMPDQGVVTEMNTPEEYAALRSLASRRGIPTEKECLAFWEILSTPGGPRSLPRRGGGRRRFARALKGILPVDTETWQRQHCSTTCPGPGGSPKRRLGRWIPGVRRPADSSGTTWISRKEPLLSEDPALPGRQGRFGKQDCRP